MASKRPRTHESTQPSSSNLPPSPPPEPSSKLTKIYTPKSSSKTGQMDNSTARALLCTLPPTCNPPHNHATELANSKELEMHYAKYHAHVCEQRGCGYVFPDARLLELHLTECHDPLAAVRKERGEKIFACLVASCARTFLTPKARRLHLIQAHEYPKEFFFAVTNKGVGGLLKRWGEGASMIRGTWKPRERDQKTDQHKGEDSDSGSNSDDSAMDEDDSDDAEQTPRMGSFANMQDTLLKKAASPSSKRKSDHHGAPIHSHTSTTSDVDHLANTMTSLSLVPPSIRFGRGGKSGGFVPPAASPRGTFGPRARGRERIHPIGHTGRGGGPGSDCGLSTGLQERDGSDSRVSPGMPARGRGKGRGAVRGS